MPLKTLPCPIVSGCFSLLLIKPLPPSKTFFQDYHSLNGALLSANSVLKRYRYTFKTDALFNELKHIVLPHMAVRLLYVAWLPSCAVRLLSKRTREYDGCCLISIATTYHTQQNHGRIFVVGPFLFLSRLERGVRCQVCCCVLPACLRARLGLGVRAISKAICKLSTTRFCANCSVTVHYTGVSRSWNPHAAAPRAFWLRFVWRRCRDLSCRTQLRGSAEEP